MPPVALLYNQGSGRDHKDCGPKGQSLDENRLIKRYAGQQSQDDQELRKPRVTRRTLACGEV
jgi:hypothetical protein